MSGVPAMAERKTNQQPSGKQPLMPASEVAELLQVSLRTVRRLIADGTLPVARIGRSVRISTETLDALLSDHARR